MYQLPISTGLKDIGEAPTTHKGLSVTFDPDKSGSNTNYEIR